MWVPHRVRRRLTRWTVRSLLIGRLLRGRVTATGAATCAWLPCGHLWFFASITDTTRLENINMRMWVVRWSLPSMWCLWGSNSSENLRHHNNARVFGVWMQQSVRFWGLIIFYFTSTIGSYIANWRATVDGCKHGHWLSGCRPQMRLPSGSVSRRLCIVTTTLLTHWRRCLPRTIKF